MAKNLLIVALQPISDREIESAVEARKEQGDVNVHVVAPAVTAGRFEWLTGADDDARAEAEKVADRTAHAIPADVETEVGEPDPLLAVHDALALFPADEILVAGTPDEKMEGGLRKLGVPVTYLDGRGDPEEGDETDAVDYARDVTQGRSAETPFVVVGTVAAVIFGLVAVISVIAFLAIWLA